MSLFDRFFGPRKSSEPQQNPAEPPPEFPYPLEAVRGAEAIQQWRVLQAKWRGEGCSAVMLGEAKDVERVKENYTLNEMPVDKVLEGAQALSADRWFRERRAQDEEYYSEIDEGTWPVAGVQQHSLGAHLHVLSRQPKSTVYFAKIPTTKSFEIPGYLRFGDWNATPGPEEQVAVLRHWSEQYGLEIYALTGDVIECEIARPPGDQESATVLAREQFVYCADIVDQGVGSILALAAVLKGARYWYFWWD